MKLRFTLPLFVLLILSFPFTAMAEGETPVIDTGDTTWLITASALVLFMFLPGLSLFYGGMLSQKNILSTMMYCFSSLVSVTIIWVLWGHTLAYGTDVNGLIGGLDYLGFSGIGTEPFGTLTIPHSVFMVFQSLFAAITVALIAGAVVERIRFKVWILFSILWTTLIYVPMAHWVWGGGWLSKIGGLDFAGGTVVHILSGVSALTAALVVGPRRSFPNRTAPPHNIVLFLIGGMMLWFGWIGFNGGSALASGAIASQAVATTQVAACMGAIVWMMMEGALRKKATLVGAVTGAIAGLVAITPAAGYVSVPGSIPIGGMASVFCYFAVNVLKSKLKFDDTLDVFGIHGIGGIWGAIATGLFASKAVNPAGSDGLFYGNPAQVYHQLADVGVTIVLGAVGTFIILKAIQLFMPLRVSTQEELDGLDLSQHGERAYNTADFGTSGLASAPELNLELDFPVLRQPHSKNI